MDDTPIWLVDDGELEEVRGVLQSAGLRVEREPQRAGPGRPVLLGSVARVADRRHQQPDALAIAVVGADERPPRGDFDAWIRRPVHPKALGVLLDALGQEGGERRWAPRVAVGAAVRTWTRHGFRRSSLVALSVGGCRVLSETPVEVGGRMILWLPRLFGWRWPCTAVGRGLRCEPNVWERPAPHSVSLAFTSVSLPARRRLHALLEHHRGALMAPAARARPQAEAKRERRQVERQPFDRRVIAHRADGPAVLVGRDLSVGGLRIEPTSDLDVGSFVQVALHVKPGTTPLVVGARVARDDGEAGLVLQFENLDGRRREYLDKMLEDLPSGGATAGGQILCELAPAGERKP